MLLRTLTRGNRRLAATVGSSKFHFEARAIANNDKMNRAELEKGDCLPSGRTLVVKIVGGHGCANERGWSCEA